ncbi:xyloglucan:xyloglucosyl transferase [Marchantia polymorpha subsp. ruderalis]|uniref:Xyloglucan endotransglucosylase/hydrolase n=2 Tax=Marchantia polymorpha TaxID=3197 RepID=A0A176WQ26_MARPO|nr:hypothetical protein AXG93_700s1030 [Marchantia polymorpha subsp. ruderalis]PTQ30005.1 hypothetical protein MARPO_0131s0006 [Marchantia polymorpha]BBN20422.1 hypothetical protein Mp_8g18980 [Marchantia polymorpha subsp. ruderalis]|eukprot:PTQ30005.1 hypothetical protein MARPO_0131s0006 [Marchantia polymorpha]
MTIRGVLTVSIALVLLGTVSAGFYDDYRIIWGGQNIVANDATSEVKLIMTESAGASFATKDVYLYGSFSVKYKLVPGDSAGTVTAFYMTSYDGRQDEIDFEFLGNVSGQPYLLHTNLFANGKGARESQFFLWFDPTADYHNYTIVWNQKQIIWLVDDIPIRIHRNIHPSVYPRLKPMGVHGTLFEASSWATRGGAVPIDWTKAPFSVSYKDFTFRSCRVYNGNTYPCRVNVKKNSWERPQYQSLNAVQRAQLRDVRARYMTYDYCNDRVRYPVQSMECPYNAQGYAL